MRIVIHFGFAKTGTTALQVAFDDARDRLLRHGVYYPDGTFHPAMHHEMRLMGDPAEDHDVPWYISRGVRSVEDLYDQSRRSIARIVRTARRRQPDVLILSSEIMLGGPGARSRLHALRRMLDPLGGDYELVAYVREPASLIASGLQQSARTHTGLVPIFPRQPRETIEMIEAVFGTQARLRAFDRRQLKDGDVIADFSDWILGRDAAEIGLRSFRENESISGEVALLNTWNRGRRGDRDKTGGSAMRYLARLRAIDQTIAGDKKARLRPSVVAEVRRASLDYVWLRDRYGVTFDELDYTAIDGTPPSYVQGYRDYADLVAYDSGRLRELAAATLAGDVRHFYSFGLNGGWGVFREANGNWYLQLGRRHFALGLANIPRNIRRLLRL